jgi:hypothetical protein
VSVGALIDHYIEHELPELRHSTQQSHSSNLNRWIRPRWGDSLLEQVKPLASILASPVLWKSCGKAVRTKALKTGFFQTALADRELSRTSSGAT